ncbi:MAG: MOSC N-terminal beta barrel domain-containing protein [Saprospiraceae bacterium]|nr:MOSC domain-containing protein [Lewinella sp.]
MTEKYLSQIFIYPIKSLAGISLESTELTARGPKWDRRWMLVDENGRFLSQRELGQMALLQVQLADDHLRVEDRRGGRPDLKIPLASTAGSEIPVTIWNDRCTAVTVSVDADRWFSEALGHSCRLVYMPEDSFRPVDPAYAAGPEFVSFADGYPYLILGEATLKHLNERLETPIEMLRFRPNLVFSGGHAFEEDEWQHFKVGQVRFRGTKPCARCQIPTIDPQTGIGAKEPTRTLATFRRKGNNIYFGMNACWSLDNSAAGRWVHLGDKILLE